MKFVFIFLTSMQAAFSSYSQPNFVNIPIFLFGSWFKFLNYIFFSISPQMFVDVTNMKNLMSQMAIFPKQFYGLHS